MKSTMQQLDNSLGNGGGKRAGVKYCWRLGYSLAHLPACQLGKRTQGNRRAGGHATRTCQYKSLMSRFNCETVGQQVSLRLNPSNTQRTTRLFVSSVFNSTH